MYFDHITPSLPGLGPPSANWSPSSQTVPLLLSALSFKIRISHQAENTRYLFFWARLNSLNTTIMIPSVFLQLTISFFVAG